MDRKTFAIGVLAIIAVILSAANLMPVQQTFAAATIKDRDYQVVTSRTQQGGDGLYILDNRTGQVAVFTWDVAARAVKLRDVRMVTEAFR
ncbi:MAG TPA: hypothetical protein PLD59_02975 [Tepidisphaeraceae bacterium]|nr:hypothetical protein [Tepidisphaeraceae bacterium]